MCSLFICAKLILQWTSAVEVAKRCEFAYFKCVHVRVRDRDNIANKDMFYFCSFLFSCRMLLTINWTPSTILTSLPAPLPPSAPLQSGTYTHTNVFSNNIAFHFMVVAFSNYEERNGGVVSEDESDGTDKKQEQGCAAAALP